MTSDGEPSRASVSRAFGSWTDTPLTDSFLPTTFVREEGLFLLEALLKARALSEVGAGLLKNRYPDEDSPLPRRALLSPGREGTHVGVGFALNPRADGQGDVLIAAQGAVGAALAFGATSTEIFGQLLHSPASPSRGRESGLHFTDLQRGLLAPVHPEAGMVEVAAGIGMAMLREGPPPHRVVTVFTGDGSSASGSWHEGLNFATVRRVPLLLVVERGVDAGEGTGRATAVNSFLEKGPGYGFEGVSVQGHDLPLLVSAARTLAQRARSGLGVQVLEVMAGEEGSDPLERFLVHLLERGLTGEAEVAELRSRVLAKVDEALERARREAEAAGWDDLLPAESNFSSRPADTAEATGPSHSLESDR